MFTENAVACSSDIVPCASSAKLCTTHGAVPFMHRGSGIVSAGGPCQTDRSGMPASIAAASVNVLNVLPACRCDWLARLNAAPRWPGATTDIARIAPVEGSIATNAAAGSPGRPSQ